MVLSDLEKMVGVEGLEEMPRDVSPRKYFRGTKSGQPIIVMQYPDLQDQSRHELSEFIRIGSWLATHDVKVPALYEENQAQGYAIFEDLGKVSFGRRIRESTVNQDEFYALGTDVLIHLAHLDAVEGLPLYEGSNIHINRRQVMDYYAAFLHQKKPSEETVRRFYAVWDDIESGLPECPKGFVHGDYHLENLMYVEAERGMRRCALIDYQDALCGPLPYDLVNLLEDARVDVPSDIRQAMIARYCVDMNAKDKDTFLKWYRVLAAQFHGRVIGLFIKLAAEQGRDEYLVHVPRLQKYLRESLQDPILAPLKSFFEKEGVDFAPLNDLDGDEIRDVFQKLS